MLTDQPQPTQFRILSTTENLVLNLVRALNLALSFKIIRANCPRAVPFEYLTSFIRSTTLSSLPTPENRIIFCVFINIHKHRPGSLAWPIRWMWLILVRDGGLSIVLFHRWLAIWNFLIPPFFFDILIEQPMKTCNENSVGDWKSTQRKRNDQSYAGTTI